jgi:Fic family protein
MEVVSGAHGREKVHYLAIPAAKIENDIEKLLEYINNSSENPYIKSAKAHLWFVSIHPYDDGNGRVARVIADYILSKNMKLEYKYFSISSAIQLDKKGYYEALESSQNLLYNREYDFTKWIKWHIQTLRASVDFGLKKVEIVVQKAKYWNKVNQEELNSRQIKVLNKLLEYPKDDFEGGLSTKKYMSMTKVSKPTAFRDMQALVAFGYLQQIEGTAGRSVKYELIL